MARDRGLRRFLSENPRCVYCGGLSTSTTIDHVPNIGMFKNRDRPKGLEVPACKACNQGSKLPEDIASFICSVQLIGPDAKHFERKLRHILNNYPSVWREFQPTSRQKKAASRWMDPSSGEPCGALDLRGPTVSSAMMLFGAKLGLALHWHQTGQILAPTGNVHVMWFTNDNFLNNEVPQQLLDRLPAGATLAMGRKHVRDQFEYASETTTEPGSSVHWVKFGTSVLYYLFASESVTFRDHGGGQIFQPGCLVKPIPFAVLASGTPD